MVISRKLDFTAGKHWEAQFRDAKGRFCTRETYKVEKTLKENNRLRLDCEKYKRMYLSAVKEYERLLRENDALKKTLKENGLKYCNVTGKGRQ